MNAADPGNKLMKRLSRNLGRYFAEIVIIFIGITISFLFDEWREEKSNQQKESEFIESLLGDLRYKKDEIQTEADGIREFMLNSDTLLTCLQKDKILNERLIGYILNSYDFDNNFFNAATPSFSASIAPDQYHGLPDSLRREIFEIYGSFDFLRLYFETVDKARFNFKSNNMTTAGIFNAHRVILLKGDTLQKPDYVKIRQYFHSDELLNNMQLILNYERDKAAIIQSIDRRIDTLVVKLRVYQELLN